MKEMKEEVMKEEVMEETVDRTETKNKLLAVLNDAADGALQGNALKADLLIRLCNTTTIREVLYFG